jgi:septal ring factor EnvC (AmiA/AmiB activator)
LIRFHNRFVRFVRFVRFGRFGRFGRFAGFVGFVGIITVCSSVAAQTGVPATRTLRGGVETPADDAKALAARAAARIRALQIEADRLAVEARTVFGDLRKLEIDRAIKREQLARLEAELAEITKAGVAAASQVRALEAARVAQSPAVASRLVEIAKRGRGGYLQLLMASDDVRAFGRLSRGVAAVAELDRVRLETHRRTLAAERAAAADLNRKHAAAAAMRKEAAAARAALDAAVAARNRAIDDLDRRRDLTAAYVSELQDAQLAVERAISTAGASPPAAALPIRPFRGDLEWPVTGKVVTGFGRAIAGRFGTTIARNGIEIGAPEGTAVRVVHGGTVAYAAPFAGFGILAIVDHGGSAFTLYGHLSEVSVAPGAAIQRGAEVGKVGLGPAGESGLYFELRIDGRPVDPVQWLRRQ